MSPVSQCLALRIGDKFLRRLRHRWSYRPTPSVVCSHHTGKVANVNITWVLSLELENSVNVPDGIYALIRIITLSN